MLRLQLSLAKVCVVVGFATYPRQPYTRRKGVTIDLPKFERRDISCRFHLVGEDYIDPTAPEDVVPAPFLHSVRYGLCTTEDGTRYVFPNMTYPLWEDGEVLALAVMARESTACDDSRRDNWGERAPGGDLDCDDDDDKRRRELRAERERDVGRPGKPGRRDARQARQLNQIRKSIRRVTFIAVLVGALVASTQPSFRAWERRLAGCLHRACREPVLLGDHAAGLELVGGSCLARR